MARRNPPPKPLTEASKPEQAAVAIAERLSGSTIQEMAEVSGLPQRTAWDLAQRVETRYAELEGIKPMLRETHEKRIAQRLEWIDTYLTHEKFLEKLDESKLKDIGIYEAVLTDKWLLLKGQPNQIIGTVEQKKMDDLAPALLSEMKRRGLSAKLTERTAEIAVAPESE
jgi:hypothetical protein